MERIPSESELVHAIKVKDLINRPIIRSDNSHEFLNKMTDEEIKQWEKEVNMILEREGFEKKFPEWNAAFIAKTIDSSIIYDLLKEESLERVELKIKVFRNKPDDNWSGWDEESFQLREHLFDLIKHYGIEIIKEEIKSCEWLLNKNENNTIL